MRRTPKRIVNRDATFGVPKKDHERLKREAEARGAQLRELPGLLLDIVESVPEEVRAQAESAAIQRRRELQTA